MNDYSENYLLDRKVKIYQPNNGYHASSDAVLLASAVIDVKNNDRILDVGSGTGAIALCLCERFKDKNICVKGLEIQSQLAELANHSAKVNNFEFAEFINILEKGFLECEISGVPSTTNQIFVGTAKSFYGKVKYLYVLGMNESITPEVLADTGLISDREINYVSNYAAPYHKAQSIFKVIIHFLM